MSSTVNIPASLVMELRAKTGAAMMDCKKYLIQADGDMEKAIQLMRESGSIKAAKKEDRITAEGGIFVVTSPDEKRGLLLEVNCETDFVALGDDFTDFAKEVAEIALTSGVSDTTELSNQTMKNSSGTVEHARQQLVAKVGENIQLRRFVILDAPGVVGAYLHGSRIGVLVALENADKNLARDLAMQITAKSPLVVSPEQVSAEVIQSERDVALAQAEQSGKPKEIIEKMVAGRINKFLDEVSLLGQEFVKDPSIKVRQLLKEKNAKVLSFVRLEVGEGIEKKQDNFIQEVMEQVKG